MPLDEGFQDTENAIMQPGGEVRDSLHPGDILPSVPIYLCPKTLARHGLLLGSGLPPRNNPEGAPALPWYAHAAPTLLSKADILIIYPLFVPLEVDS